MVSTASNLSQPDKREMIGEYLKKRLEARADMEEGNSARPESSKKSAAEQHLIEKFLSSDEAKDLHKNNEILDNLREGLIINKMSEQDLKAQRLARLAARMKMLKMMLQSADAQSAKAMLAELKQIVSELKSLGGSAGGSAQMPMSPPANGQSSDQAVSDEMVNQLFNELTGTKETSQSAAQTPADKQSLSGNGEKTGNAERIGDVARNANVHGQGQTQNDGEVSEKSDSDKENKAQKNRALYLLAQQSYQKEDKEDKEFFDKLVKDGDGGFDAGVADLMKDAKKLLKQIVKKLKGGDFSDQEKREIVTMIKSIASDFSSTNVGGAGGSAEGSESADVRVATGNSVGVDATSGLPEGIDVANVNITIENGAGVDGAVSEATFDTVDADIDQATQEQNDGDLGTGSLVNEVKNSWRNRENEQEQRASA